MEKIDVSSLKVSSEIDLTEFSGSLDLGLKKKELKEQLKKNRKKLADWQDVLYAHGKYSILVCLQGMDTAGKDSLIREVFKGFNTRGVVVHSFKVPTSLELKHDFLWRHYLALPARGKFGIFNRTHYENVLVTRVHPEYILNENLPDINSLEDIDEDFWGRRFRQINDFERHLTENGTIIFKFFLHISKEEQRQRLLRRLNKSKKNWKFSPGDLQERDLWEKYRQAYTEAINRTSTQDAPWYVIPSNSKISARYLISEILWNKLQSYKDVQEPELEPDIKKHLEAYRDALSKELNEPD